VLQVAQAGRGPANFFEASAAFRDDSGHRFVVAGDDDFLAAGDAVEQLAEPGLCIKSSYGGHGGLI